MRIAASGVGLASLMCLAALAEAPRPMVPVGRGPATKPAAKKIDWGNAQIVFTGKLEKATAGPVGMSLPPLHTHRLEFAVEKVLRGDLEPGQKVICSHSARQDKAPVFPAGKVCLVAASEARSQIRAHSVQVADAQKVKDAELAAALPLGWEARKGELVSPWAFLGEKAWPAGTKKSAGLVCSKTSRPALLAGGVVLDVNPVPPAKKIKWTNPDGDGEYQITVTNPTDKPLEIPALLSDHTGILWKESLVIRCQGRAYIIPGSKGLRSAPRPTTLEPGKSVSTVVNALQLDGPEWPRGGYRIEFQFCLGEKSQTQSFYYMSRHHDGIRESLKSK